MSWLDDLGSAVGGAWDWLTETNAGNSLLTMGGTALAAWTLNRVNSNVKPVNQTKPTAKNPKKPGSSPSAPVINVENVPDAGVRLQLNASTENKIPVVYGSAWISGKLIDVKQTPNRGSMILTYALCEKTGKINLGQGPDSIITCKDVYWNNNRLIFQENGWLIRGFVDDTGAENTEISGGIQVYLYNGNSEMPTVPTTSGAQNHGMFAYQVMADFGWTPQWMLNDLVFAIVVVTYNKSKGLTNVGNFKFHLENTLKQPGDCLYDYMTNVRYGAKMDPTEVFSQ